MPTLNTRKMYMNFREKRINNVNTGFNTNTNNINNNRQIKSISSSPGFQLNMLGRLNGSVNCGSCGKN